MSGSDANAARLAAHERLVAALLREPASLPAPPAERSLVTTSISSLVMACDEVFKLRKPLVLDYLDFSTTELRRRDCEEELRLNRRTAPALYLDVQPVTGTIDAPRVGGDAATAIDWALRMRRFDDRQRLDRLAERGALDADVIDALAAAVADLHTAQPPSPPHFGRAEDVQRWARANFDELERGPAAHSHRARLTALRVWTDAECERLAPLIGRRHAQRRVREGHGDLHLANIVLVDGRPLLFDCLEFNPALRHIDPMADLAFLFMDLQRRGLPALAWRVVNGWAEHTGDYEALALLHFFAVYRALVRAKVALLRAGQHDAGAWPAFERDLALAEALSAPRREPARLVVTSGVSGSGKSTVAQALVDGLGAIRIRSDVERKRLFDQPPTWRPDADEAARVYARDATERTYARLRALATMLLAAGLHVVVDAACLRRDERDAMRAVAQAAGARWTLVECSASEDELRRRVQRRMAEGQDASDADLAVLDRQLALREPLGADEGALALSTDTDRETLRRRALALLPIA